MELQDKLKQGKSAAAMGRMYHMNESIVPQAAPPWQQTNSPFHLAIVHSSVVVVVNMYVVCY